ncbi:MAG: enoyl-CoA hydratase [Proteobacteria bacterium]|nr:MAG: enoyl-CoA hydratase [Pseudomonadota bacterium]
MIHLERRGRVALLTIDRPARRNALNEAMWGQLDALLAELEAALPRAVVITGAGDQAFCAGMDVNPDNPQIGRLVGAVQRGERAPALALLESLRAVLDRLAALPVPTIAAINGRAYGGGAELAVRCDLRVIDPGASMCFSEVTLGLMPDLGGGVALTRLVGPGRAADLILTAREVRADEALMLGLVNQVCVTDMVVETALAMGEAIAANGPRAVRASLEVIRRTPDLTEEDALALELDRAASLIATGECATGISAFMARKKPEFPEP